MLKKFLILLTPHERKRAGALVGMTLLMALVDMLGVASILPFMAVLTNPELVETNVFLGTAFRRASAIGIDSIESFLFVLGLLTLMVLLASLAFKAFVTYAQTRYVMMRQYSISKLMIESYLRQPYAWFLQRNSADLSKTILSEVGTVVTKGMVPLTHLFAQAMVALALLILLIVVDPILALSTGLVVGTAYSLIFAGLSGWIKNLGQIRVRVNQQRFTAASEAFGAVKEVKVGGLEQVYIKRFAEPAEIYARCQATAQLVSQLPRYALEAIVFGGMLLAVLYLMSKNGSFLAALPVITLYAFAGYRLMPAVQTIYQAFTQLRYVTSSLDALYRDLISLQASDPTQEQTSRLPLTKAITLSKVSYHYPNASKTALKEVDLSIPARSIVGFVGATGSGKTTTVDVILGLLEPQSGHLSVDGKRITAANRRQWQSGIGYVPQDIFLTDDSIAANIALGVPSSEIDLNAVQRSAEVANIHDFILNELPQGYGTIVGERGVRLSGGQRQRIGLARALYHDPQVLILDEATSALDTLTEKKVMEALNNFRRDMTIILIAHRLSTVRQCSTLFLMEGGNLIGFGTYDELSDRSPQFAAMAKSN